MLERHSITLQESNALNMGSMEEVDRHFNDHSELKPDSALTARFPGRTSGGKEVPGLAKWARSQCCDENEMHGVRANNKGRVTGWTYTADGS